MSNLDLKTTPLDALHHAHGAKMTPFAGYMMPLRYASGIMAEHQHTRARASLFDVSHMGQLRLSGRNVAAQLETLVPGDILSLDAGSMRYTLLLSESGGILDDLIVTHAGDYHFVVVNAGRKASDVAHLKSNLNCIIEEFEDRALLALQGPFAEVVLEGLAPGVAGLAFMQAGAFALAGVTCLVSRSGYTGEDGFEISVPAERAPEIAETLLAHEAVELAGLGARDSLRLEAGLCLYGQDLGPDISPVEAALEWTIAKRRRSEAGFPGAAVILRQLADGASRRRVGIRPEGRAPVRAGMEILDSEGASVGTVSSGGFGPSIGAPVAMGYVAVPACRTGMTVDVVVRGRPLPARLTALPFVTHRYKRS